MATPIRQIYHNAGLEESIVVERIKVEKIGIGFNALTGEWGNMEDTGIVDPTKVTRSALQNAAPVSAMLLTTEAVIAEKPEENEGGGMHEMSDMGGMM